jgi:hypothetical protein
MSDDSVVAQIAALRRMTTPQLKLEWEKLIDRPPPAFNRRFLASVDVELEHHCRVITRAVPSPRARHQRAR